MADLADRRTRKRARRRLRPHALSVLCAGALVVAAVFGRGALHHYADQQAQDQLHHRGNDLSLVASLASGRLYASLEGLRNTLDLAGGEHATFDAAAKRLIDRGFLGGAAQLDPRTFARVDAVGAPVHLATPTTAQRADLRRGTTATGMIAVSSFGSGNGTTMGYVVGPTIARTGTLLYVELPMSSFAALFASTGALEQLTETLRTVELALYLGRAGRSAPLFGDAVAMARARRTYVQPLTFGGQRWSVALGDKSPETALERNGPDAVLVAGLLAAVLLGLLVEVMGRRRAALVASEERHRLLLQHASDVILQLDAALRVERQSPSATSVLGYVPGSLLGASLVDLVHPADAAGCMAVIEPHLGRPGEAFELAFRLRDAAGTWRHVEATGTSLLREPSVGAVVLNVRDVTERRLAEEATARLASIVEATSDMVVTVRPDGRLLDVNDAGRETLGLASGVALEGVRVNDLVADDESDRLLAVAASLASRDRTWGGELAVRTASGATMPVLGVVVAHEGDEGVEYFSAVLRDISDRKSLEDQLAHQAFHDSLTGLANRALLLDRLAHGLARAERKGHTNAVLLVDLDDFKAVNDSLGHLSGDDLIRQVAHRLQTHARAGDTVARLGGDEFAVVLDDVDLPDATALAERLVHELNRPFLVADREIFTTASIGVALSDADTVDAEQLLRDADVALYRAKDTGKGRHAAFEPSMRSSAMVRLTLRRDLARAVERGEFVLHYQPIVDLSTARVTGLEALIRWQHPEHGLVSPLEFIPLAEETGLIVPLGRWALQQATCQLGTWQQCHPDLQPLYMSVNVSGRQLVEPSFIGDVIAALGAARLAHRQLVLEITESVLVRRGGDIAAQLQQLRGTGVRVAIDDFGTGYSSLSSLEQLPIDILKIDKAFVDNVGDTTSEPVIVTAITRLSSAMGLDIVAEGIEREEQRTGLVELACPHGQGYLFARPMPADEVLAALLSAGETAAADA